MNLRISTIPKMLDIIEKNNNGQNVDVELKELLNHEDYIAQFEFYKNHSAKISFTKDEFMKMFNSIDDYQPHSGTSKALVMRNKDLKTVFNDTESFRKKYNNLLDISEDDFYNVLTKTNQGLLFPIDLNDVDIIVSIGVGVTGGFNQGNINFLDLVKSVSNKTKEGFLNTISHELHHKGFKEQFKIEYAQFRMVDVFIHYFAGEGMAIKFGNNFEGILTKKIHNGEHTALKESYDYYIENSKVIFEQFLKDLLEIENGKYSNFEELEELFDKNYYYRDIVADGEIRKFYLLNPIAYYLGADIWGLMYDTLERKTFYKLLKDPKGIYEVFLDKFLKNTM